MAHALTWPRGFDRQGPRASQPSLQYPNADPKVIARLGGRTLVEWWPCLHGHRRGHEPLADHPVGRLRPLPALEIFFAETRLGWLPFWMEEADYGT